MRGIMGFLRFWSVARPPNAWQLPAPSPTAKDGAIPGGDATNTHDAFEGILLSPHRAMLDDAHWPATAALIDKAVGTACSGVGVSEGFDDDAHVHFVGSYQRGERRRDLEREYLNFHHPHVERMPRMRLLPDSRLVHVPDLYSEKELKTSFAYNEGPRRFDSRTA